MLEDLGELSFLDLAGAALSPQPTVTHALRRLEARGLIQRTAGKDDKRNRFISITSTGSELTRMLMGEARRLETQALSELGDLDELVVQLVELTEAIKQLPRAELEMGA